MAWSAEDWGHILKGGSAARYKKKLYFQMVLGVGFGGGTCRCSPLSTPISAGRAWECTGSGSSGQAAWSGRSPGSPLPGHPLGSLYGACPGWLAGGVASPWASGCLPVHPGGTFAMAALWSSRPLGNGVLGGSYPWPLGWAPEPPSPLSWVPGEEGKGDLLKLQVTTPVCSDPTGIFSSLFTLQFTKHLGFYRRFQIKKYSGL